MSEDRRIVILGRFPPPYDGQAVATERLFELISGTYAVEQLNTNYPEPAGLEQNSWSSIGRWRHYLRLNKRNRIALGRPNQLILWPAISPDLLGHYRDLLTVVRHVHPTSVLIAVVHRGNFAKLFSRLPMRLTAPHIARRVDRFVFNDEHLAGQCAPWLPDWKRALMPNTVDRAVIATDEDLKLKWARQADRPLRLLFLSNMFVEKGYLDVVAAAIELKRRGLAVEVQLVGRWSSEGDRQQCAQRIAEVGVEELVRILPPVADRAEVHQHHLRADVFLLPTYYRNEAQPLSIIEALANGTPVITTRHAGIPEMLKDEKDGLFVPAKSPWAIADAVERLMDRDRWLEMSKAARSRFDAQFHPDVVRQRWLELTEGVSPV